MAQAISADAFLKAIQGDTVDYALPGVGLVRVRALTVSEAQSVASGGVVTDDAMLKVLRVALIEPALNDEQWAVLTQAKAGPVMRLATYVMRLSGMTDDEITQGEAGGGS